MITIRGTGPNRERHPDDLVPCSRKDSSLGELSYLAMQGQPQLLGECPVSEYEPPKVSRLKELFEDCANGSGISTVPSSNLKKSALGGKEKLDREKSKLDPEKSKPGPEKTKLDSEKSIPDPEKKAKPDSEKVKLDPEKTKPDPEKTKPNPKKLNVDPEKTKLVPELEINRREAEELENRFPNGATNFHGASSDVNRLSIDQTKKYFENSKQASNNEFGEDIAPYKEATVNADIDKPADNCLWLNIQLICDSRRNVEPGEVVDVTLNKENCGKKHGFSFAGGQPSRNGPIGIYIKTIHSSALADDCQCLDAGRSIRRIF